MTTQPMSEFEKRYVLESQLQVARVRVELDGELFRILEADNARLRALLKDAEWVGVEGGSFACSYCEAGFYGGEAKAPHKDNCPAFRPDGEVR